MKLKDKTIIFIAHRTNITCKTDRIIVLERGKIIEEGTHNQLINKDGSYYQTLFS